MRFSLVHKLVSYLLVLAGFSSLALSGELALWTLGIGLLALPLSWFWEGPQRLARAARFWQVASGLFLVYWTVAAIRGTPLLGLGIDLLVYMQVNRLFNRKTSKDYLQLYVLAFLELVAGATLNSGISYGITFAAFVVFATWSMTLLHLRRETEENYLLKHSEDAQSEKVEVERILSSRRIIGGQFLLGTSLVSLGVFGGSLIVFLVFPRIGLGLLGGAGRPGLSITGFSESISLDGFGVLRDNPTVVMRVEIDGPGYKDGQPAVLGFRWRGVAFDHYDGTSWTRPRRHRRRRLMPGPDGKLARPAWTRLLPGHPVKATAYLEPLDTDVLFVPGRPVELDFGSPPVPAAARLVEHGPDDDVHVLRGTALRYMVTGDLSPLPPDPPPTQKELLPYLELPALSPQIAELTRRIIAEAGATTDRAKATALQRYLSTRYRYTTVLHPRPAGQALPDFLFGRQEGHCEYFSTAMAVMLRTAGIPSRNVSGFAGGTWNPVGRYYAIRSGDAHSWVEAYLSGEGWTTFDPTPPSAVVATLAPGSGLGHLLDALRLRWLKWIIEYDLGRQVGALRRLERWWQGEGAAGEGGSRPGRAQWLLIVAAVAAVMVLILRRPRAVPQSEAGQEVALLPAQQRALELYRRLLMVLERRGWAKPPQQTGRDFAAQLSRQGSNVAERVSQAVELYERARFGAEIKNPEERARVERELRQLVHVISREADKRGVPGPG
jgi:transglutaminase-like putative cysteine protease